MTIRFQPVETAKLSWNESNDLPTSETYHDVYFSRSGAIDESQLVFIEGNRLSDRFEKNETTVVGELGFGFGINFLATLKHFKAVRGPHSRLIFISTEKHPVERRDLERVYERVPELRKESSALLSSYPHLFAGFHAIVFDEWQAELWLLVGDATDSLKELEASVDAWYLDGFSPKENPALWGDEVIAEMARLSRSEETTIASYSVAGEVRRRLERAGFFVEKKQGFAHKRERLEGRFMRHPDGMALGPSRSRFDLGFNPKKRLASVQTHRVAVVGAGMAGVSCAEALAYSGFQVQLIDAKDGWVRECSALPRALYKPHVTGGASAVSMLTLRAFDFLTRRLHGAPQGVLKFEHDSIAYEKIARLVRERILPDTLIEERQSDRGFHYPSAGSLDPVQTLSEWMSRVKDRVHCRFNTEVARIERNDRGEWGLYAKDGACMTEADSIVLAAGAKMPELVQDRHVEFRFVRGQLEVVRPENAGDQARLPHHVIQDESHWSPFGRDGLAAIGSTYDPSDRSLSPKAEETRRLLDSAESLVGIPFASVRSHVGIRTTTVDRLPMIGPFSIELPGLYTFSALASRGMTFSAWGGHLVSHFIRGVALPLERALIEEVHPLRFKYRHEH